MADSASDHLDGGAQEPQPGEARNVEELGAALQKYREGQDAVGRLKKTRIALSILLVFVIVGFLMLFYTTASSMWDPDEFKEPVNLEIDRLTPSIRNTARNALERVKPEYINRARETFESIRPHLAAQVRKEWKEAGPALAAGARKDFRDAIVRVYYRQNDELKKHFPKLEDEVRRELLRVRFEEDLRDDIDDILVEFETTYVRDVQALERTLQKFRPNKYERLPKQELGRYFVLLWLKLVSYRLEESIREGK